MIVAPGLVRDAFGYMAGLEFGRRPPKTIRKFPDHYDSSGSGKSRCALLQNYSEDAPCQHIENVTVRRLVTTAVQEAISRSLATSSLNDCSSFHLERVP